MKETAGTRLARAVPKAALTIVSVLLLGAGIAHAGYLTDGTKPAGAGAYQNPQDGVCVVGLKFDGTLDVNTSIKTYEECVTYTNATLKGMTTSAACTGGAGNTDGYKHTWATSICVDNLIDKNPISRVNLDRSATASCSAVGGTMINAAITPATGVCVAYGWQYMNAKSGEAIPYRTTVNPVAYKGRTSADNLGFCYATMRMTTVTGYTTNTVGGCPAYHNSNTIAPASEWPLGTDGAKYQTQASYDAGLGWTFTSPECLYAYGTKGYVNAALTKADGTVFAAAGAFVDLTALTTQGDCLAAGASWDNWLPISSASVLNPATTPNPSSIVKLDATTPVLSGGGDFYSGTGAVCQKCHSDQSRGYMERYKPGFPKTGHKLAGENPVFQGAIGPVWGIKGVQCEICHATGKPTAQDVGVVVNPNTTGTNSGLPRAASGHNQTEYGSHVTGVCYKCHGTPAGSVTDTLSPNPAAVIPTSGGEFAKTAFQVAPIVNQFLASSHAKYSGATATSRTVDVVTKTNYTSTFKGNACRGSFTTGSITAGSAALSTANSIAAGLTVKVWGAGASGGVLQTTVVSVAGSSAPYTVTLSATASTTVTQTAVSYLDLTTVLTGAVTTKQGGVGQGSILTTWIDKGVAEKIPNLDTAANLYCEGSPIKQADGTAYAGGFWVGDGEAGGTANSVAYEMSNQGNCMTCHDIHWSKDDTATYDGVNKPEPFRRECTTCHVNSGTSLTSAPQINLPSIKHPGGVGTPLESTPDHACETCHMPKLTSSGSNMHLWTISTNAAYSTAGASQANADSDGFIKVDLNAACGQCHGGDNTASTTGSITAASKALTVASANGFAIGANVAVAGAGVAGANLNSTVASIAGTTVTLANAASTTVAGAAVAFNPTTTGAPYMSKASMAGWAKGIHQDNLFFASFTAMYGSNGSIVNVNAGASTCSGSAANCNSYDWNWGDNTTHGSGAAATHTYATPGTFTITLTITQNGIGSGTATQTFTAYAVVNRPNANGTCVIDYVAWTATCTNTSAAPDAGYQQLVFDWGDGTVINTVNAAPWNAPVVHTFLVPGNYKIKLKVVDTLGQQSTKTFPATVAANFTYSTINGTVRDNLAAPLGAAQILVRKSGTLVKSTMTAANGTYALTIKPGTYTVEASKSGYTFPAATSVTVPPVATVIITANP